MSAHTLVTTDDAHTLETDFEVPAPRKVAIYSTSAEAKCIVTST